MSMASSFASFGPSAISSSGTPNSVTDNKSFFGSDDSQTTNRQIEEIGRLLHEGKHKATELNISLKSLEHNRTRMQNQVSKARDEINDTFQFYISVLEEIKAETLKELDDQYNSKLLSLTLSTSGVHEAIEKMSQLDKMSETFRKFTSPDELFSLRQIIESRLRVLRGFDQESNKPNCFDIEFVSDFQAIRTTARNNFGYIRCATTDQTTKQLPISRPNGLSSLHCSHQNGYESLLKNPVLPNHSFFGSGNVNANTTLGDTANANCRSYSTSSSITDSITNMTNMYEKWSIAGSGSPDSVLFTSSTNSTNPLLDSSPFSDPVIDLSGKLLNGSVVTLKSQIKRQKMIYHCKFGEFGVMEGQFTEPSGVAVNAQNDIIVADTNNHRIQIFDKEGRFKFQFGECGKRDGQLLYPNRVAVVKNSGDIIVTERSPTHQIQIYNQYGQFVRKFGANILQHPRGVTVDNKGRIIVVECKVMRVLIFDQMGNVLQKFGCSKHLEFPNGVVVNDKQEIFISDNRAHCVKVFSYEGHFLRQIGGEGLTNYPIGVCINDAGEILVADNHNNFNITIFTQDGQLISALESKVKHAQCFDVALMDDNSVVLASKDYRIYIYRYLQLQSIAQAVAASSLS